MPLLPPDNEAFTNGICLVDELALMVEGAPIVRHNHSSSFSEDEVFLAVDLKANVNFTFVEESDLRKVVKLVVKNGPLLLVSWL